MKKYLILIAIPIFLIFVYFGVLGFAEEQTGATKDERSKEMSQPSDKKEQAENPKAGSPQEENRPTGKVQTGVPKTEGPQENNQLSGKVVETMDSGSYTYVLLETASGQLWVAVPKMKVTKGQTVSFMQGGEMVNFESKTLKRKFDKIIFSAGPVKEQGEAKGPQSPGSEGSVVRTTENIKVEKATGPNAYTVEEIFRLSGDLDKKDVMIRAKVVKVSQGIMNRNWVHIQDGTGAPDKGNRDLVVTSNEVPLVGDTVIVNGTIAKDKDFGSGYKYSVIVENGTFKK